LYGCLALFPLLLFLLWWRAHVDTAGTLLAINRFFGSTRDRRLTHPITVIRVDLKRGYHRHLHQVGGG
jgi:hypothetical protein